MSLTYFSLPKFAFIVRGIYQLVTQHIVHGWSKGFQLVWGHFTGRSFIIEIRNTDYKFRIQTGSNLWTIGETIVEGEYERADLTLPESPTIIDVGGNIGGFAVNFAKKYPKGRILAYEPFPGSYELLIDNVKLNNVHNVQTFPYAVGGEAGTTILDTSWMFTSMYTTLSTNNESGKGIEVRETTLSEIFKENNIDHLDLLKMDCEGSEFPIMFNASDEMLGKIDLILMEYHNERTEYSDQDMARFLEEKGFEVTVEPHEGMYDVGYILARQTN